MYYELPNGEKIAMLGIKKDIPSNFLKTKGGEVRGVRGANPVEVALSPLSYAKS